MLKSRALTSVLVVGSVAVASVFAAAPASAATLPSGQQITVINNVDWSFFEASPADASLTAVGTGTPADDTTLTGVDVDDDGHGYAVANKEGPGSIDGYVYTADANTGVLSGGVPITLNFGDVFPPADECTAIDYTGGIVYAACILYVDETDVTYVGPLDPVTGVLEPVMEFNGSSMEFPILYIPAIATDPLTGILYGFSWNIDDSPETTAWILSEDAGAEFVTEVDNPLMVANALYGADFDRGGQLWITVKTPVVDGDFVYSRPALATLDLSDGSSPFLAPFTVGGELLDQTADPITVWGKEALAATGAVQNPAVALGAIALLLFGAILAAGTVAMRRRSLESP